MSRALPDFPTGSYISPVFCLLLLPTSMAGLATHLHCCHCSPWLFLLKLLAGLQSWGHVFCRAITVFSLIKVWHLGLQCLLLGHSNYIPRGPEKWAPEDTTMCYTLVYMKAQCLDVSSMFSEGKKSWIGKDAAIFVKFCLFPKLSIPAQPVCSPWGMKISLHGLIRNLPKALGHPKPTYHHSSEFFLADFRKS